MLRNKLTLLDLRRELNVHLFTIKCYLFLCNSNASLRILKDDCIFNSLFRHWSELNMMSAEILYENFNF